MTKKLIAISTLAVSVAIAGQSFAADKADKPLATEAQRLSYTIGFEMGQNFKKQNVTVDAKALVNGLTDGLAGKPGLLDDKQRKETVQAFQKKMVAQHQEQQKTTAEANAKAGEAFLAANAKKEGVKSLENGLQYRILTPGTGPKPTLNDTVTVNYAGSFIDGKEFDSSYKRGKPTTFALNQVIKGWQQALTQMPTGSTWQIFVPAKLAYGEQGMGPIIGPNKTLVFKIELISVDKKKT